MPILHEDAVRDLFGLPVDLAVAGLIALGHPVHQPTRLRRQRVEEFTTLGTFDGPAFTEPPPR